MKTSERREIALCDSRGEAVFDSLVQPLYNRPLRSTKEQRYETSEFTVAPDWAVVRAKSAPLIEGRLLIAYNASFDRRAMAAMCSRHRRAHPQKGGGL